MENQLLKTDSLALNSRRSQCTEGYESASTASAGRSGAIITASNTPCGNGRCGSASIPSDMTSSRLATAAPR